MNEKDKKCCTPYFYLFKKRKFKLGRLYKVYVKGNSLFGAKIAGQIYKRSSVISSTTESSIVDFLIFILDLFLSLWSDDKVKKRNELEKQYDASELETTDFLNKDKENFIINKWDIDKVNIFIRRRPWTWLSSNIGTMFMKTKQNETIKFVIIGEQDIKYIAEIFSSLGVDVEIRDERLIYNKL